MMRRYFSDVADWLKVPWERFLGLGATIAWLLYAHRQRLDAALEHACDGATIDGRSPAADGGGSTVPNDTLGDE